MRDLLSQPFLASLSGSLISAAVTIAGALWLWRFQVRGKRRAEVAEEALIAFQEIVDQLNYCRLGTRHLQIEHEIPDDVSERWGEHGRDFKLVLERIASQAHLFATIRKHQLLCEVHFGHVPAGAFADLSEIIVEIRRKATLGARLSEVLARDKPVLEASGENGPHSANLRDATEAQGFVFGIPEDKVGDRLATANANLLRHLKPAIN
ncbi:hypothetical protein [Sediminicoccus sp. BL-A-41-H5]|uniref:hypothetical protein n=1 Tax=Sediminicoccus sp. BL-A-41-H5 TaxID=3421106 RepID=UPI003D67BB99